MKRSQSGMTLIEVLVGLFLTTTVVFTCLMFMTTAYHTTGRNVEKQFATQKAISMLEELKSLVQVQGNSVQMLDAFDDGSAYNTILTTDRSVINPASPVSGNVSLPTSLWKYKRQVTVSLLPGTNDDSVRLVNVKVCIDKDENGDGNPDILGEVAGVIRTLAGPYPPTQVYDVYAIAIENVPGWWVYMSNLIPFVQNAVQDLESRNPGLHFRVHWITKHSYGRDSQYRPYINRAQDSTQPINWVYFYPGSMPSGSGDDYYYPPDNFRGHVLIDGTDTNGYNAATNPNPYALADVYNHAMRYSDELALFNQRVASGQESDDAPTLRILLERIYQDPFTYRNAILINLHGELLPFPPIRNYSDAAKEPGGYQNLRAVTHPEYLRYPNTASSVRLRVYSYRTDPDNSTAATNRDWLGENTGSAPIRVTLKGVSWTPASGSTDVVAVMGGTDQDGAAGGDPYQVVNATTTSSATGMYYTSTTVGGDTVISLYNSPLKTPEVSAGAGNYRGLNSNERLYGLEYIPAPMEDLTASSSPPTPFSINLASNHTLSGSSCNGGTCDKNTARWIITVPSSVLPAGSSGSEMITVETRINSTTSGTRTDDPPNLSRTYVWKGTGTWLFGDGTAANPPHLPLTEQFQVLGDPRHNPYADLKMPHLGSGLPLENALGMGYNRYFDDFENSSADKGVTPGPNWQGYHYTAGGQSYGIKNDGTTGNDAWGTSGGMLEIDVGRVHHTLRTVFKRSRVVFTTMTGFSFFYLGVGNEIGYDSANNFPNSIPISSRPFNGTNAAAYEQSILSGGGCNPGGSFGCGVKYIRSNSGGTYWWGLNWLGELYPDSSYTGGSGWTSVGNLPTGTGAGTFSRTLRSNINNSLPAGTTLLNTGRRPQEEGSTSFYWTGSANSTFHHVYSGGTGNLLSAGTDASGRYNYPLSNGISINRPFNTDIDNTGMNPDHFLQPVYGPALTAGVQAQYYNHSVSSGNFGSSLLTFDDTSNNVEFVVVNGISMTGLSGTSFIANWSMLSLVHSFMESGRYNAANGFANHIEQVPRIVITSPDFSTNLTNPSTILVGWSRSWLRWDGQSYSASFPSGYSESTPLSYTVMYSDDNGASWKYMQDDTAATPGVRPASSAHLISTASPSPTYAWSTPAGSFPQGTYIIRVECYRDTLPLHYSFHQYRAFIRR